MALGVGSRGVELPAPGPGAIGTCACRGPFRRSSDVRVLAGVCGGLSQATGIDVTLIRIGFVLLTLGSGIGIPVYALAWLFLPLQGETTTIFSRAVNDRRGIRLVIALLPALVVIQIVADAWHIGYVGLVQLAGLPGRRHRHPHPAQRQ